MRLSAADSHFWVARKQQKEITLFNGAVPWCIRSAFKLYHTDTCCFRYDFLLFCAPGRHFNYRKNIKLMEIWSQSRSPSQECMEGSRHEQLLYSRFENSPCPSLENALRFTVSTLPKSPHSSCESELPSYCETLSSWEIMWSETVYSRASWKAAGYFV